MLKHFSVYPIRVQLFVTKKGKKKIFFFGNIQHHWNSCNVFLLLVMSEFFWVELVPLIRDWKDLVFRSANACTLQIGSSKRRASRCLVILINLRGTLFRVLYLLVHYYNNCMEEVSWIRCKPSYVLCFLPSQHFNVASMLIQGCVWTLK